MGTPFISHLGPSDLSGYDRTKPHDEQPAGIPREFIDAMEVRESVFVKEQGVPLKYEHDSDDSRSHHWVIYASVNQVVQHEEKDAARNVTRPRRSSTRTVPIGTLRLVPFPHPPHPPNGSRYIDNELVYSPEGSEFTASQEARQNSPVPYGRDRATTYHDGVEAYVKLGRLAVVKEYRGHRIAGQLWGAARQWLIANPEFADPSVSEMGMQRLAARSVKEIPRWKGLVCVHSQEQAIGIWQKWGFRVDEGLGRWTEEGIPHVGMFTRIELGERIIKIK